MGSHEWLLDLWTLDIGEWGGLGVRIGGWGAIWGAGGLPGVP